MVIKTHFDISNQILSHFSEESLLISLLIYKICGQSVEFTCFQGFLILYSYLLSEPYVFSQEVKSSKFFVYFVGRKQKVPGLHFLLTCQIDVLRKFLIQTPMMLEKCSKHLLMLHCACRKITKIPRDKKTMNKKTIS